MPILYFHCRRQHDGQNSRSSTEEVVMNSSSDLPAAQAARVEKLMSEFSGWDGLVPLDEVAGWTDDEVLQLREPALH